MKKHFADGRITAVNGSQFTVQVLGGDLVYTEDVKIYREPDYNNKTLLARAELSIVQPYAISASGTLTDLAVRPGDEVHPGDYLFSYVPDVLSPALRGEANPTAVTAPQALIVTEVSVLPGASVQKDQALLSAIPAGTYRLKAQATEADVDRIAAGDEMTVSFDELDLPPVTATVTAVDPLATGARKPAALPCGWILKRLTACFPACTPLCRAAPPLDRAARLDYTGFIGLPFFGTQPFLPRFAAMLIDKEGG